MEFMVTPFMAAYHSIGLCVVRFRKWEPNGCCGNDLTLNRRIHSSDRPKCHRSKRQKLQGGGATACRAHLAIEQTTSTDINGQVEPNLWCRRAALIAKHAVDTNGR